MFIREKALLKKIKKTEKKRLERLKNKEAEKHEEENVEEDSPTSPESNLVDNTIQSTSENESSEPEEKKPTKRKQKQSEEVESSPKKKKKKLKQSDDTDLSLSDIKQECTATFTNLSFESLDISEKTLKAIKEMGFSKMTEIQAKSIPLLLELKNLVGIAKTGSGKTLAFLIHAIEFVFKLKYRQYQGTGVIILSPTRELAMQTYGVLIELMKHHNHSFALIIGGANKKKEAEKLFHGVNIIVATPGRLLDHMKNTKPFKYDRAYCLVIDEADRILDAGFEKEMVELIQLLPKLRHNILFSATESQKIQALKSMIYQKDPIHIRIGQEENATVSGLRQEAVFCASEDRMMYLFSLVNEFKDKKAMFFFNSCVSAKFHADVINCFDHGVKCIHGKQKQNIRTRTYFQYCNATKGILFCTDVAARGWDIPGVDWIVQFEPPTDPKEYIHRVGRTARGEGEVGNSLLILRREEKQFLAHLKAANVECPVYPILWEKLPNPEKFRDELTHLVSNNYYLLHTARQAFDGYVRSYSSLPLKHIFNVDTLDQNKVCRSFGLLKPTSQLLKTTEKQNGMAKKKKFKNS